MKIIEIVESRQDEYHKLDIMLSRIQVFSKLVMRNIEYILDHPYIALDQEFQEIINEIDDDIVTLQKIIDFAKIGMNRNNQRHRQANKFMTNVITSIRSTRSRIQSNLSEADIPSQSSMLSPLSSTKRDSAPVDPRIAARQRKRDRELRRFMGRRD